MFEGRESYVGNGVVTLIELAGAHLETAARTNGDAVDNIFERHFDSVEVGKRTAGYGDVMAVALVVFGVEIVGLEVFRRPRKSDEGYAVVLSDFREVEHRGGSSVVVGVNKDGLHVGHVGVVSFVHGISVLCPLEVGF